MSDARSLYVAAPADADSVDAAVRAVKPAGIETRVEDAVEVPGFPVAVDVLAGDDVATAAAMTDLAKALSARLQWSVITDDQADARSTGAD